MKLHKLLQILRDEISRGQHIGMCSAISNEVMYHPLVTTRDVQKLKSYIQKQGNKQDIQWRISSTSDNDYVPTRLKGYFMFPPPDVDTRLMWLDIHIEKQLKKHNKKKRAKVAPRYWKCTCGCGMNIKNTC